MNSFWLVVAVLILLGCYGGMHYYIYRKLCWVFPRHKRVIIISLSLLAVSLIVVQVLVHTGSSRWVIYLAWLPSLWMGYVFLFFSLAAITDLLFKAVSLDNKGGVAARISPRVRSITIAGLTLLVCVAGFVSAQQINIQTYTLAAAKLKRPITLVQISDLHLGLLSSEDHLRRQVAKINASLIQKFNNDCREILFRNPLDDDKKGTKEDNQVPVNQFDDALGFHFATAEQDSGHCDGGQFPGD